MYHDPVFGTTLMEYMDTINKYLDKIDRIEQEIEEITKEECYKETVGRICCIKGIDRISALTITVEIGDFERFDSAKVFPINVNVNMCNSTNVKMHNIGRVHIYININALWCQRWHAQ